MKKYESQVIRKIGVINVTIKTINENRKGVNGMIKTLAKQIKEFKAASIATPLFMILESIDGDDHPVSDGIDHR